MKSLLIIIFALLVQNAFAQMDSEGHQKAHRRYWYYRTRLINDFMKIGKNQGESIVIAERNLGKTATNPSPKLSLVGPDQIDIINQYIIVLALEYKMLSRAGQNTEETINELFHLLYMINRLDLEADQFWQPSPPTGSVISPNGGWPNGFMIRDDMPSDFLLQNENHFNYGLQLGVGTNNGFCGSDYTDQSESKFTEYVSTPTFTKKDEMAMVFDKYISMLTALMFVDKYIPDNLTCGNEVFQDGENKIKQEARNMSSRLFSYLQGPAFTWVLTFPDNTFSDPHVLPVGNVASWYAWPLSRMACYVNDDFPWSTVKPCFQYNDQTVLISKPIWEIYSTLTQPPLQPPFAEDAAVFMAYTQAGSNRRGINFSPAYIAMMLNVAAWHLEWAPLMRKVLHQNGALLVQSSVYENILAAAPCQGPYNYNDGNYGSWEWSSQCRTEHPGRRGDNPTYFPGDFPGVDYMLLHNLYYEYQNQLMEGYNGNVATWGNAGGVVGAAVTWVYNAANNAANSVVVGGCNAANTVAGWWGGSVNCPTNNSGNGGAGSAISITPYLPYNLMDNHDVNIWPRELTLGPFSWSPTITQGTSSFPAKVKVFQNLFSSAHIYATASPSASTNSLTSNVEYRAGKEITFTNGFTVEAGSEFHAYVQRYLCNGAGDPLNLRKMYDSTAVGDSAHYEDDYMNLVPIHVFPNQYLSASDLTPVVNDSLDSLSLTYIDDETQQTARAMQNNISGIAAQNSSPSIKIIPNPNNGKFIVDFGKENEGINKFEIINSYGKMIYSKSDYINSIENLNLDEASGMYILIIYFENRIETKKILVE